MELLTQKINKSLSPSYRALKPKRDELEVFKKALSKYFQMIDSSESEENLKTHLMDLLKKSFSPNHIVEQQGDIDCVIRTGKKSTKAGVLFETKRSKNKSDMISQGNPNKKALHELILYYLRERDGGNTDIKYLVICTELEFYIFTADQFERNFFKSSKMRKDFKEWSEGKKSDHTTDFFYNSIAKPFLDSDDIELTATHFDLSDFKKSLDKSEDKKLVSLDLSRFSSASLMSNVHQGEVIWHTNIQKNSVQRPFG